MLYDGADELKTEVKLDWREKHKGLKLSFPINIEKPESIYEIPYGSIKRPCDGKENSGQMWLAVTGKDYSVILFNDSKYGFSVRGAEMRMTVARSPIYADHCGVRRPERDYDYLDTGEQRFSYALYGQNGILSRAAAAKRALVLNNDFQAVPEGSHGGILKPKAGYVSADKENIVISVLKRAEENDGVIIRAYEAEGKKTAAVISFFGKSLKACFSPHEIKTLKFICGAGEAYETDILEEKLIGQKFTT